MWIGSTDELSASFIALNVAEALPTGLREPIARDAPALTVVERVNTRIVFSSAGLAADMQGEYACMLAPGGRRNIISESWLKTLGIAADKLSLQLRWPDGQWCSFTEENGLFFVWAAMAPIPEGAEASTATVSAHDQRLVWAVRLGVNSEELVRADEASTGLNVGRMTKATAEIIDSDEFRKRQRRGASRPPAGHPSTEEPSAQGSGSSSTDSASTARRPQATARYTKCTPSTSTPTSATRSG